jgi:hypothetical protein
MLDEKELTNEGGLPNGIFSNKKIPIWVNFGRFLQWKMLVYLMVSCSNVRPYGIVMAIGYI